MPRRLFTPAVLLAALVLSARPALPDEPAGAGVKPPAPDSKGTNGAKAPATAATLPTTVTSAVSIPRGAALLEALKTKRVKNVKWTDMSLKDMVEWLRIATGWNFLVNQAELAKANVDASSLSFSIELADVSLATLLEVTLQPLGLSIRIQDNLVWITSKADAQGKLVTRVYGISHITWQKIDFAAPDINLQPSGFTPSMEYEPEKVVEDDPLVTGEAVADMVKEIVAPGEWETEGWALRATKTYLTIRAPLAVHAKIPRAIATISSLK